MGIEFELKFSATPQQQEKILREFPGEAVEYRMQTTYYDTPSGALAARHWTLRRRMENAVSICTLKTPAGKDGRKEWETECDSIEEAVEKLCKLAGDTELSLLGKEGLLPVCGAEFTRIARTLEILDGTLELALDKGILTGGGRERPLCEVEVEQKTCTPEVCEAFARALAEQYGLQPEPLSKFARAYALHKGE